MARERKRAEERSEGAPEWLTTYSDLVTLLLTFFIMLFSMATIDVQKFRVIAESMASTFNLNSGTDQFNVSTGREIINLPAQNEKDSEVQNQYNNGEKDSSGGTAGEEDTLEMKKARNAKILEEVKEEIEKAIEEHDLMDNVQLIDEKDTLVLRLRQIDGVLFDTGKADIKPEGKELLNKLGGMLKELNNEITVEGHTDNRPINTVLFPSNWELSTKRATNVVRYFIDYVGIAPQKLTAQGRGEYKPVAPNDTAENMAKNRRIDIVVQKYIFAE